MFDFAKLLLFVAFGYAMITFYEAPIPGFGVSFSNLITDQAFYFQSVLEARSFDNIYRHLDELADHFMQPDAWSILANLLYWTVLLLVAVAKALSLAVIAFGLIASAVCALLGPIFVPFFIVKQLDWLFWGWLKSFIQYSFIPVVAIAFLMVFEQFVLQVRHDTAADDHAGRVRHLRSAVPGGPGNVLRGHPARPVADQFDLLRTGGRERAPDEREPWAAPAQIGGEAMPRRFPDEPVREQRVASPEFTRLLVVAFGIAASIGLVSGLVWLVWLLLTR